MEKINKNKLRYFVMIIEPNIITVSVEHKNRE